MTATEPTLVDCFMEIGRIQGMLAYVAEPEPVNPTREEARVLLARLSPEDREELVLWLFLHDAGVTGKGRALLAVGGVEALWRDTRASRRNRSNGDRKRRRKAERA